MTLDPVGPNVHSLEATEGARPPNRGSRARRALIWLTSLIILAALAFWLTLQRDAYQTFRSELTTYRDVTIGQNKIEVQYAVDAPQTVQGPATAMPNGWSYSNPLRVDERPNPHIPAGYARIPNGKSVMDYDSWHYWNAEGTFDVEFNRRSHLVENISCWSSSAPRQTTCPPLFGIRSGMTEEEVLARLGEADNSELMGGGMVEDQPVLVTKKLTYNMLGLRLTLAEKRVRGIEKRAPGEVGFWWWFTHGRL